MYVCMYVSMYVVEFHKTIVEFRCGAPLDVVELHLLHTSSLLEWSAVVEFPMWTSGVEHVCGAPHWEVVAEVDSTPIVAFLSFYTVPFLFFPSRQLSLLWDRFNPCCKSGHGGCGGEGVGVL